MGSLLLQARVRSQRLLALLHHVLLLFKVSNTVSQGPLKASPFSIKIVHGKDIKRNVREPNAQIRLPLEDTATEPKPPEVALSKVIRLELF